MLSRTRWPDLRATVDDVTEVLERALPERAVRASVRIVDAEVDAAAALARLLRVLATSSAGSVKFRPGSTLPGGASAASQRGSTESTPVRMPGPGYERLLSGIAGAYVAGAMSDAVSGREPTPFSSP